MAGRENIYYWKCDRPSAFFAINTDNTKNQKKYMDEVRELLAEFFQTDDFILQKGSGQGNHLTFIAIHDSKKFFIRIENGPEGDEYMEVEAFVIQQTYNLGIPTPRIYKVDSTRLQYPFSYQIMEYIELADLNIIYKDDKLDTPIIMYKLGQYIAQWQQMTFEQFGPFDIYALREDHKLKALHPTYKDYYTLNLQKHLDFLVDNQFLTKDISEEITQTIKQHEELLDIKEGCLVHKDIAFWNILGTSNKIERIIDWDDTISGDPTDDISLMACFHNTKEIEALIDGYQSIKILPVNFEKRFWLHLLRNMLFKAVIRVGAGYFNKNDNFYLINSGTNGHTDLYNFTLSRISLAIEGLEGIKTLQDL